MNRLSTSTTNSRHDNAEEVPGMIRVNIPGKGRGMQATRAWNSPGGGGGLIVHTERPIAVLPAPLDAAWQGKHCDHCLTPLQVPSVSSSTISQSLPSCSSCGVHYCSSSCQQTAQQYGHSLLCGFDEATALKPLDASLASSNNSHSSSRGTSAPPRAIPALPSQSYEWTSSSVPRFPYLAARLLTRHVLESWTPSQTDTNGLWNNQLRRLCSSTMDMERFKDDYERYIHHMTRALTRPPSPSPSQQQSHAQATPSSDAIANVRSMLQSTIPMSLYLHVMGILHLNVFAIHAMNGDGPKIGTVLFHDASFFNHSCTPLLQIQHNVAPDGSITFRSLRPINVGDELTVDYVGFPPEATTAERQRYLRWAYGFQCDCARCVASPAPVDTPPSAPLPVRRPYKLPSTPS